jgi:hypothetical protein
MKYFHSSICYGVGRCRFLSLLMFNPTSKCAIALAALSALSGCSNLGKSYSQIDPAGALADIRKHNGYDSVKKIVPGTAKLVVRSGGGSYDVRFSINKQDDACQGFNKFATTRDNGRGVLLPRIADMSPGPDGFASTDLAPGKTVVVRGESSYLTMTPAGGNSVSSGHCGPMYSKFTPELNHAYIVEFNWVGKSCEQSVVDATDPDAPVPVAAEPVLACKTQ